MFCIAKEPLSQRKNEIIIFLQNYLYKTKVISTPSANKKRGIHSPQLFFYRNKNTARQMLLAKTLEGFRKIVDNIACDKAFLA